MKTLVIALAATLGAGAAHAEGLPMNPGMWETTMTRTDPFGGEPITETKSECVTETSFDPATMMETDQGCAITQNEVDGDTLSFAMECDTQGAKSSMSGKYQTDGETGTGDMKVEVNAAGMNMSMEMTWTAERTGDC